MVAPALISAGATLLGGLLGRKKAVAPITAGDNAFSHVEGIMRASKQYGFHPLTLLGSVSPVGGTPGQPADNSAFGQAIANAGMIAADAIAAKPSQAQKLNAYQVQNQRLTAKLNAISVRPPVPGLYGRARSPSDPEVYGGTSSSAASAAMGAGRPAGIPFRDAARLPSYNWTDPDVRSQSDDGSRVPVKPLYLGGVPLVPRSGTSDAEAIGSRYGEDFMSPSWFAGWGAFGYDVYAGAKKSVGDRAGRIGDAILKDMGVGKYNPYRNDLPLKSWEQTWSFN